jgi:hypothetical protein
MAAAFLRLFLCSFLVLAACSATPPDDRGPSKSLRGSPPPGNEADIAALTVAIQALGPEVDPEEAARAARISYEHTYTLAIDYQITDPALIHNIKVNMGLKPRGLCKHWAEDMEKRLLVEDFQTLTIHRGIGRLVGVDHSTAIISRVGDDMYDGIVVDPWRKGGRLTWIHTDVDTAWGWEPQLVVLDRRARELAAEQGVGTIFYAAEGVGPRCLNAANADGVSQAATSQENLDRCISGQNADLDSAMLEIDQTASGL